MSKRPLPAGPKHDRAAFAVRLAQMGDLEGARTAFIEAINFDRRNLDLPYNLAIVEEQLGEIAHAAELLTAVLDQKPDYPQAAARLSRLVARFEVADPAVLVPAGLAAALRTPGIAHQPLVDVALRRQLACDEVLAQSVLAIEQGMVPRSVGRNLLEPKLSASLSAGLLQAGLRQGIVRHAGIERLLTGVRAAMLLDCPPLRLHDRAFTELLLALVQQGWHNDHAWAETPEETAALDATVIDRGGVLAGDLAATASLLKAALYRPVETLTTPPLTATEAHRLKPRSVRDTIEPELAAHERRRALAASMPSLRPAADPVSLKVAGQYESAPYPRWSSLHLSPAGALKRTLATHFAPERLAFMDGDFDVLVAGCGTGQHALQAAAAYGTGARLLALDLSRASLGYAADMARRYPLPNITFMQGDILDAGALDRRFDIVECVGVLHHMADWRAGWRSLLAVLKPQGLMYIGLYSAASRRGLAALRQEPGYPGPGCSDAAARAWRHDLLMRQDDAAGGDLKISRDFYALHAFRDLVLHESEAHVTLAEIAAFLEANGLVFHGFTLEASVLDEFHAAYPRSDGPGMLADWSAFEAAHPRTFDGMYRFWIGRGG